MVKTKASARANVDTESLRALLQPKSIALIGASPRAGSPGNILVNNVINGGYTGSAYAVNPGHSSVENLPCFGSLSEIPREVEHAVISLADARLDQALDDAIEHGVRAITIFGGAFEARQDGSMSLRDSIARKARAAGIAVCGPNCMGFASPAHGLVVSTFPPHSRIRAGGIAWLAQSGSAYSILGYNDSRLGFSLCVSTGAEIVSTLSDYIHYALNDGRTRVIGIFLEGIRDSQGFVAALEAAQEKGIPVVVLKVGRTSRSASMALSHAGALAGNDGVYTALFNKYNVIQVDDLNEMVATLALLEFGKKPAAGNLASIHDSGGQRELLVDLADRHGVDFAALSNDSLEKIQDNLDAGLTADNPLDAWGKPHDFGQRYRNCMQTLLADPEVSMLGFYTDLRDGNQYHIDTVEAVIDVADKSEKPVFFVTSAWLNLDDQLANLAANAEIPVIKGYRESVLAIGKISKWTRNAKVGGGRDDSVLVPGFSEARGDLLTGELNELNGLRFLSQCNVSVPRAEFIDDESQLGTLVGEFEYPLVLKTNEGYAHKSDCGGVIRNINSRNELIESYRELSSRLGPRAIVMEMVPEGIEIGFGAIMDAEYGPVCVLSAGGTLIELMADSKFICAPVSARDCRRYLMELEIARLLQGTRGSEAVDIDRLCETIAKLSQVIYALKDDIEEFEVNPLIASAKCTTAVDCLIVPKDN